MRRQPNQTRTAKHRLPVPGDGQRVVQRIIEMVDTGDTAHFLTMTAAETGRANGGRYTTLCAEEIVPAALVARAARYCRLCAPR